MAVDSIELFFQEGSSDKVYNARIVEVGADLYTVEVEWGRRGNTLSTGTKAVSVPLAKARAAFDKVVRQKQKKGYEVWTDDVVPAAVAPPVGQGSGSKAGVHRRARLGAGAQLLTTADASEVEAFLVDASYVAQQKFDGVRIVAHVQAEGVTVTNRNGEITSVDARVITALSAAPVGTVIDGELCAGTYLVYWVFDVLSIGGEPVDSLGYLERYHRLAGLCADLDDPIEMVDTAVSEAEKRALLADLEDDAAEGIVFKQSGAAYTPGRPASGGTQRKYKFVKTADVFITHNAGNAYAMAVFADGVQTAVGNVFAGTTNATRADLDTALANGEQPVVEVRYLYATDADILYQGVFVRIRDDKLPEECLLDQLVRTDKDAVSTFR